MRLYAEQLHPRRTQLLLLSVRLPGGGARQCWWHNLSLVSTTDICTSFWRTPWPALESLGATSRKSLRPDCPCQHLVLPRLRAIFSCHEVIFALANLPWLSAPCCTKARKEAFVSNLTGGTLLEINLVTLVAPVRASENHPRHPFPDTSSGMLSVYLQDSFSKNAHCAGLS